MSRALPLLSKAWPLKVLSSSSFYQELRYDLAESRRVTFREWQIEVIDASNSGIRFRVLDD